VGHVVPIRAPFDGFPVGKNRVARTAVPGEDQGLGGGHRLGQEADAREIGRRGDVLDGSLDARIQHAQRFDRAVRQGTEQQQDRTSCRRRRDRRRGFSAGAAEHGALRRQAGSHNRAAALAVRQCVAVGWICNAVAGAAALRLLRAALATSFGVTFAAQDGA